MMHLSYSTMSVIWDPFYLVDSGCFASDTSIPPDDQFVCTVVLVQPAKEQGVKICPHPRQHSRPIKSYLSTERHMPILLEDTSADSEGNDSTKQHRASNGSPHLLIRTSTNPFEKEDKSEQVNSSLLSPLASLPSLADTPPTPPTPKECIATNPSGAAAPPCFPRDDGSARFSENQSWYPLAPFLQ